jgi:hypothetical protein
LAIFDRDALDRHVFRQDIAPIAHARVSLFQCATHVVAAIEQQQVPPPFLVSIDDWSPEVRIALRLLPLASASGPTFHRAPRNVRFFQSTPDLTELPTETRTARRMGGQVR